MATAADLINRALRLAEQIPAGASGTAAELADGLTALNAMLDSWRNNRLMCYATQDQSLALASGNSTRTVGPTGNLVTTRPVKIEAAYIEYLNYTYPMGELTDLQFAAIGDKTSTSSWPTWFYYQPGMPNGTLYLYPVPNLSSTLHLITWTPVTSFASTSTTVSLPPGWEDALAHNLAVRIAPEYGREVLPTVRRGAVESLAELKRINANPVLAHTDLGRLFDRRMPNILSGGW